MEMENSNFYVVELNGLRNLANGLLQFKSDFIHGKKDQFADELACIITSIQRDIQFRQLHLDGGALVFMDHLQSELIQLSDDCNTFLLSDKKSHIDADTKTCLIIVLEAINNLIDHFKENYSYCFNFKMLVPIRYKQKTDLTLAKMCERLIQTLKQSGIDDKLLEVLKMYFLEMKSNKRPNFHLLDFWYTMTHGLNKVTPGSVNEVEHNLCSFFCYHNFNYLPFIQYCISRMQRDHDAIDNYREEYIKITVNIKILRQLIVRKDYNYDTTTINLKEALCDILENELLCIKKLINMNKKIFEGRGTRFFLQQFYFKISISMEQFLFIFRLLIDKGIVLVKRKADLYEFIHAHVGTAKKDNLSIGNMQNTYAENNRITAIKVKTLLQSLIKHIDEKYLFICCILLVF